MKILLQNVEKILKKCFQLPKVKIILLEKACTICLQVLFTVLIYSSYEDYDLALENFTKAQPYFENAHLDENWIFPNFKENNKFMIDLIEIILSKSQDKASRFVELGDAFKDKNWKLKYSSMSRCGYELNKIGAFKEAAYMLEESKKTIFEEYSFIKLISLSENLPMAIIPSKSFSSSDS